MVTKLSGFEYVMAAEGGTALTLVNAITQDGERTQNIYNGQLRRFLQHPALLLPTTTVLCNFSTTNLDFLCHVGLPTSSYAEDQPWSISPPVPTRRSPCLPHPAWGHEHRG